MICRDINRKLRRIFGIKLFCIQTHLFIWILASSKSFCNDFTLCGINSTFFHNLLNSSQLIFYNSLTRIFMWIIKIESITIMTIITGKYSYISSLTLTNPPIKLLNFSNIVCFYLTLPYLFRCCNCKYTSNRLT